MTATTLLTLDIVDQVPAGALDGEHGATVAVDVDSIPAETSSVRQCFSAVTRGEAYKLFLG